MVVVDLDPETKAARMAAAAAAAAREGRPANGSSNDEGNGIDSKATNDGDTNQQEMDKNGVSENSVYFDKIEAGTTLPLSFSGNNLEDVDNPKLVNAVIDNETAANVKDSIESDLNASTSNPTLTDENTIAARGGANENAWFDIEEGSDYEIIELEFESAVEKVHTHTPYCPKCRYPITKVILRRKKHPDQPPVDKPDGGLFGCSRCLSIFTRWGKRLNPFRICGAEEHESGAGGPTDAVGSANVEQGEYGFDLCGMFRKKIKDQKAPDPEGTSQKAPDPLLEGHPSPEPSVPRDDVAIKIGCIVVPGQQEVISEESLEILKCIVHGGLMESIASLSIVSSAAASDATTLNIIALGVASVISGLLVFSRNLVDLKNENANQETDRYLLGRRGHFPLHATFALLSFLVFGIIPPIVYGFSFRESDNKDYKILAVAAASFISVFILAIGKAYVTRPQKYTEYFTSVLYYITMAISISGVAYAAGDLIKMLMDRLGWFEPNQTGPSFVPHAISAMSASY